MSRQDLDSTLTRIERALAELPATAAHLVPDLVLRSYVYDAYENAKAVRLLLDSTLRQRAFPNARACFEAAQQALMLTTDSNYDLAGAKAWVYAHRKDLKQATQAELAGLLSDLPDHLPADEYFGRRFEEMKETWNMFSPAKGSLLNQAEIALDKQPKRPDNWAGVDIAKALEQRLDAMPNPKGIELPPTRPSALLRSAYALLNRETHPRSSRLEADIVRGTANGAVEFVFKADDAAEQADLAEVLTISSLNLALAAFAARVTMDRGA